MQHISAAPCGFTAALCGLFIAGILSSTASLADEASDLARNQVQSMDAPSANTAGPNATTKASIKASGDNSGASTQIAHAWGIPSLNGLFVGRLLAAAPFSDSNSPKPDTGSVSSLTAGVNTRLDANFLWLPKSKAETVNAYHTALSDICNSFIRAVLGSPYYFDVPAGERAPLDDPNGTYGVSFQTPHSCYELLQPDVLLDVVAMLNKATVTRNQKHKAAKEQPENLIVLPSAWTDLAKSTYAKLQKAETPHFSLLQSVGISLLGNQHNNSFVEPDAPTKVMKKSDEGYGVGVNYTALFRSASIIVGYSYERPFKTGMSEQICSPLGATTSTTCSTASVGIPTRTTAHIASLETRILFGSVLAIGPRIEYDTASANLGIKLPVYFVADSKKILSGGIEVGWTKTAGYQGTVVIEKAFSFLD